MSCCLSFSPSHPFPRRTPFQFR